MAQKSIVITDFSGAMGSSISEKKDIAHASRFTKGLNPFEDPAYVTLARKTTKVSALIVTDLVLWGQDGSPWDNNRYFYGNTGNIYKEANQSTWSVLSAGGSSTGQGLLVHDNKLYIAKETEIMRYGPLDNSPSMDTTFADWGPTSDLQTTGGGTGAADYVPPVAISETATNRQSFTAEHDAITSITINVDVVGTGNWEVRIHDSNNVIPDWGTKTIANASMVVGDNVFTFTNPVRVLPGESYHFHVLSTVADGGVDTSAATDLEGATYTVQYATLISATYHPMIKFTDTVIIGNERYLATWDGTTYDPTAISFPPGFEVRSLTKLDEYIVASCWKGQSFAEAEEAYLYFWDGSSPSYNFPIPITVGAPNAIAGWKNKLFGVYGNRGSMHMGYAPFEEVVDEVPKIARGKKVEIYPGAISEFEGKILIGIAGSTDDASGVEQGVYEFASQSSGLPEVLNFPHVISTGTTQGTTLQIGMVQSFGDDLYIGWKDGATEGVDKITAGDAAATSGTWESLIFDGGNPNKEMLPLTLTVTTKALATGESVTPKHRYDRATNFTSGTTVTAGSATSAEEGLYTRCKEIEFGFTLASSNDTYPQVTSVVFEYDDLSSEQVE